MLPRRRAGADLHSHVREGPGWHGPKLALRFTWLGVAGLTAVLFPPLMRRPWLQNKENLMGVKKFLGEAAGVPSRRRIVGRWACRRRSVPLPLPLRPPLLPPSNPLLPSHAPLAAPAAYALAHDDTYAVSIRQMINWMQNPVPADQLTKQLLGCGNKGGAGGDLAGFLAGPAKPAPVVGPAGQAQAVHSGNGVASKSVVASGPFDTLLADVVAAAEEAKAAAARSPFENLLHDLTN